MRCRANGRKRPTERGPQAGTVPPALPARLTAGVGAAAWAGAGGGSGQNQEEPRRLVRQAQPRAVAGSGGASSSCAAKDSVDGGAGLWLRTWRPPRPAPSAASTAPASSRDSGSNAHAHAHPGPLRRPPVSRTAQPSQQPPSRRLPPCARATPSPPAQLPPLRPLGASAGNPGQSARAPPPGVSPPFSCSGQSDGTRGAEPWEYGGGCPKGPKLQPRRLPGAVVPLP